MTLYTQADRNIRKTWLYTGSFLILVIFIGWFISYILGYYIVFWVAVIYSVLMSFLSYWYSDRIVLMMAHAKPIEKRDNPELYRLVENLCITAGLSLPKIYIINETQPNAFATGRNPKHGVVAITQGLLDKLERAELEGVISHEMAHIGNRDALLQTVVVVLVGIIAMITDVFWRVGFRIRGDRRDRVEGRLGVIIVIVGFILLALAPILSNLLKLAISRKREFLADASGALLTRYPEGLARALEKISSDPNVLKTANNSTAHLYIISPFRGKEAGSWFAKLFSTHPPIEERVRVLRGMRV